MEKDKNVPTLLPYLEPSEAILSLKPSLISDEAEIQEKNPFPFLIFSDADPLTRLMEARFVTDAGSEIKRVFLLIQRDRYRIQTEDLWPISNPKIDELWQEAYAFHTNKDQGTQPILLSPQIGEDNKLIPLHSLFFCRERRLYFHPPCPKCGWLLHLCDDDDLLVQSGLQPYSLSMKRYLFCPSCCQKGNRDFYVYELEPNDIPGMKDRHSLMREYRQFIQKQKADIEFPCFECHQKEECFGPSGRVFTRMLPFSFYPFHMLIFAAMSLHAMDFLPLISGATFKEVETLLIRRGEKGRALSMNFIHRGQLARSPVLFHQKEKNFFEILYLKLTFLEEMIQALFPSREADRYHNLKFSMDRVWVKLSSQSSHLPFFWSFKVKILDIGTPLPAPASLHPLPLSESFHFLTRLWFFALLVNKKQDISTAFQLFISEGEGSQQDGLIHRVPPASIFWDPDGKTVDQTAFPFWEKTLQLGLSLYQNRFSNDLTWMKETFLKELEALRLSVNHHLFSEATGVADRTKRPETTIEKKERGETVRDILMSIADRWHRDAESEEFLQETVILPSIRNKISSSYRSHGEQPAPEGGASRGGQIDVPPEQAGEPLKDSILVETVILGRRKGGPDFSSSDQGNLQRPLQKEGMQPPDKFPEENVEEDVLAETVILGPQTAQEKQRKIKKND